MFTRPLFPAVTRQWAWRECSMRSLTMFSHCRTKSSFFRLNFRLQASFMTSASTPRAF
ncbi:unnamed protein product [Musa acuminata subsp. malaccensis]|uniref:(wild Malaysian banana) hypothetical protein n=1 Tax=Musa acuminata subsp. malaccensis TaxID=214687 RepID=A0A804I6H1_MUSAM|nr:unnamed protein product [Musa acuminata subsp. malaccensis]